VGIEYQGLLPKAQQQQFSQWLTEQLTLWAQAWIPSSNGQLKVQSSTFAKQLFSTTKVTCATEKVIVNGAGFCCFFADTKLSCVGELTLGGANNQADKDLAVFIGQKMQNQFNDQLTLGDIVQTNDNVDGVTYISSVCTVKFSIGQVPLELVFTSAYLHQFNLRLIAEQKPSYNNASLKTMVGSQQVSLPLSMQSQSITVKQLMTLQVGHVIPLQQLIKSPLIVGEQAKQTRLNGFLVKNGGNKAVFISGVEK
jgi:flagellar motor switch/type III secretory pathway protein FliN